MRRGRRRNAPHERSGKAVDVADRSEEVARRELCRLVDLTWRVGRRQHQVRLAGDVVELLHRVPCEVRADRFFELLQLVVGRGVHVPRVPIALGQLGELSDQLEARDAGLAAAQAERHEPVDRGPDLACAADVGAAAMTAEPGSRESGRHRHARADDDLLHRHVDLLGDSGPQRRQRRERRFGPTVRVPRGLGATNGGAVGIAGHVHVSARGHDPEIGGPPRRARSVETERRDAYPDRVGRATGVEHVRPRDAGRVEHHMRVAKQRIELGTIGCEAVDALARVPRTRDVAREDVALRGNHPLNGSAEVAEHPSSTRGGIAAEIDDA